MPRGIDTPWVSPACAGPASAMPATHDAIDKDIDARKRRLLITGRVLHGAVPSLNTHQHTRTR